MFVLRYVVQIKGLVIKQIKYLNMCMRSPWGNAAHHSPWTPLPVRSPPHVSWGSLVVLTVYDRARDGKRKWLRQLKWYVCMPFGRVEVAQCFRKHSVESRASPNTYDNTKHMRSLGCISNIDRMLINVCVVTTSAVFVTTIRSERAIIDWTVINTNVWKRCAYVLNTLQTNVSQTKTKMSECLPVA